MQTPKKFRPAYTCLTSGTAIAVLSWFSSPVLAQATEEAIPFDLGTLVLDARKVDEPLQRVPFGISVLGGEAADTRRVDDPVDLARTTPGLNLGDTGLRGSNIPNIRGVGSFLPQSPDDASTPVFVDGIPLAVRAQDRALFDVERIDVLRGPQNTLYGRNAQAGAINVTTADPTFAPEYRLNLEVGEDGYGRVRAVASGPLSDTFAYRFAGQLRTQDGNIPNLSSIGGALRENDQVNIAAKFLWRPSALTDVRLTLRYGKYEETPTQGVLLDDLNFPRSAVDVDTPYDLETLGLGLTVEHDFGGFRFTSITGVQGYDSFYRSDDTDGFIFEARTGQPPAAFEDPDADFRVIEDDDIQYSQEFRFDGAFANGGTWVAGVNAFRADLDLDLTFNADGIIQGDFDNSFTTEGIGVFGEVTVPVTDRLNLIGGLRYTYEDKSFTSVFTDNSGGTLGASGADASSDTFDYVTGRAGITYDLVPDITMFATLARGAKSGGFQLADSDLSRGASVSRYETAFTDTAEIGLRGNAFEGQLDFAASLFFNDTKNEHLQVFDVSTLESVIENADTETYGLELEAGFQATPSLRLAGALALLETEITASDDPAVQVGNEVPFAPSVSYSLAVEHESDMQFFGRSGVLKARAEYQYVGRRATDPQNRTSLESFGVVDVRLGWQRGNTEFYAFVDNLFDETYAESAFVFGPSPTGGFVSGAIPGNPRRIGFGVDIRF
ncbi:TonB-dependent receptor [uncultured Roseobacter sp.]|uniref:TonB-dependent receptor n=1 Tax=uncultured Roseobacter sp. TaxID=114847 RepID=UPI002637D025|nr:TonB-dependent receptor [uncultured Roseobacter sp.]